MKCLSVCLWDLHCEWGHVWVAVLEPGAHLYSICHLNYLVRPVSLVRLEVSLTTHHLIVSALQGLLPHLITVRCLSRHVPPLSHYYHHCELEEDLKVCLRPSQGGGDTVWAIQITTEPLVLSSSASLVTDLERNSSWDKKRTGLGNFIVINAHRQGMSGLSGTFKLHENVHSKGFWVDLPTGKGFQLTFKWDSMQRFRYWILFSLHSTINLLKWPFCFYLGHPLFYRFFNSVWVRDY